MSLTVRTNICICCNKYFVISSDGSWESPVCRFSSAQIFVYTCRQTLQLPLISISVIIKIIISVINSRRRKRRGRRRSVHGLWQWKSKLFCLLKMNLFLYPPYTRCTLRAVLVGSGRSSFFVTMNGAVALLKSLHATTSMQLRATLTVNATRAIKTDEQILFDRA